MTQQLQCRLVRQQPRQMGRQLPVHARRGHLREHLAGPLAGRQTEGGHDHRLTVPGEDPNLLPVEVPSIGERDGQAVAQCRVAVEQIAGAAQCQQQPQQLQVVAAEWLDPACDGLGASEPESMEGPASTLGGALLGFGCASTVVRAICQRQRELQRLRRRGAGIALGAIGADQRIVGCERQPAGPAIPLAHRGQVRPSLDELHFSRLEDVQRFVLEAGVRACIRHGRALIAWP
jgi:hypothetical protein